MSSLAEELPREFWIYGKYGGSDTPVIPGCWARSVFSAPFGCQASGLSRLLCVVCLQLVELGMRRQSTPTLTFANHQPLYCRLVGLVVSECTTMVALLAGQYALLGRLVSYARCIEHAVLRAVMTA